MINIVAERNMLSTSSLLTEKEQALNKSKLSVN